MSKPVRMSTQDGFIYANGETNLFLGVDGYDVVDSIDKAGVFPKVSFIGARSKQIINVYEFQPIPAKVTTTVELV